MYDVGPTACCEAGNVLNKVVLKCPYKETKLAPFDSTHLCDSNDIHMAPNGPQEGAP